MSSAEAVSPAKMHQRALGHLDTRLAGDEQEVRSLASSVQNPDAKNSELTCVGLGQRLRHADQRRSEAP